MAENNETKSQSPKSDINKNNIEKKVQTNKKNSTSYLLSGSIIILLLSLALSSAFPQIKDIINSITTTTPVKSTNSENIINSVKPDEPKDEFHPKLIISNDNSDKKYEFKCTFEINETTKELVKRFPLNMRMVDLNGTEKYHTLEEPLPVKIEPVDKVRYGDILLFQSRYLAVFYDTFDPVKQYSIIGKIDNPELLREAVGTGSITASFVQDNWRI